MRCARWLLAITLAAASPALLAVDVDVEPRIPPGYHPEPESKDERGLWMEMREFETSLQQSPLLVRDAELNAYIEALMCRVAGDYCPDIRVYLMRNPAFNAFMTPNGMMVLWTGVLIRVSSADELATVLGHETAHYLRTHSLLGFRKAKRELAAGSIFSMGVGVLTGVFLPVGESLALLSSLSFSREQETEADVLGTRLLAEAGYDPHAAYRVWEALIAEEKSAAAKRDKPGVFSHTHPDAEHRAAELREFVNKRYGEPAPVAEAHASYAAVLSDHYELFMEDQLDTNRYGRTAYLLDQHAVMGIDSGLVEFFRGEMYRQRAAEGDAELARQAYLRSIATEHPHPEAYRNLGYLALKAKDLPTAQGHFRKYLAARPDASDRAMIEFYLEETS